VDVPRRIQNSGNHERQLQLDCMLTSTKLVNDYQRVFGGRLDRISVGNFFTSQRDDALL
jgi:hypothetical protein